MIKVSKEVREFFAAMGSIGGRADGKRKARSAEHYRAASAKRWTKWREENPNKISKTAHKRRRAGTSLSSTRPAAISRKGKTI